MFQHRFYSLTSFASDRVLQHVRVLITLIGCAGLIAAVLAFQQLLLEVYTACWSIALLFALLGLMVALLLGQYRLQTVKTEKASIHWSVLSSLTVTVLGMGVVVCLLNTTPPLS